jgi:hypothetical protein
MTFLRYFFLIIAGALTSAVLGALFACVVALVSPEFIHDLFRPPNGAELIRYAAAVGMVWGIFLGTAAMGFSLFLVTAVQVAKLLKQKSDAKSDL